MTGLVVLLVLARIVGVNPGRTTPGLWLRGELVEERITDWSFAKGVNITDTSVQSRLWFLPLVAYSTHVSRHHLKDRLYYGSLYPAGVDFAEVGTWNRNVAADPNVRIKIADKRGTTCSSMAAS